MLRSVIAVVAGFVFIGVLSFGTDAALRAAGVFPAHGEPVTATGPLLLSMAYVAIYAIVGCYLAARLAPNRPMFHALVLGGLGLAFNVVAVASLWDTVPAWYSVGGVLLTMVYAWIGGRIREREVERGAQLATS